MSSNQNISAIARKSTRIVVVLYVIVKQLLVMTDAVIAEHYWMYRIAASAIMVLLAFIVTDKRVSNRTAAALSGPALAVAELVWVAFVPPVGEWIVYIFLIGCSLVTMLYLDIRGLLISMLISASTAAFFTFGMGIVMSGAELSTWHDIFGLSGLVMINILIFFICKFSVGTFARSKRTERIFDILLDTTTGYMVIINESSKVEYISESFSNWLGISQREYAIKRPILDLCRGSDLAAMFQEVMEDSKSNDERQYELYVDGVHYWFFMRSSLIEMEGGKTVRTIELSDITPIMEAKNEAEAATKAKSNFLATMSHEIRTPMNAILGIAQIQLQNDSLPTEYASEFEKIHSSGNSLLGIINDILDMSKIETGKMELNPAEYDLPSLINDAIHLNVVRIGSKPIEFLLHIDEDLPSRLHGDELRIKQILNNLLSNAIKYTDKGHIRLTVSHQSTESAVILCFSIEDTGQGMKTEDLDKLFSEYSRFNAETNRSIEGTGLGLNITKSLVGMMGGTIRAESKYGKGSIFTVTLTQGKVECPAIGRELAQNLMSFTFSGGKRGGRMDFSIDPMPYGRVLVVDDVETNLYVAKGMLTPYNLNIEMASSGFAALDIIAGGNRFDIIFMDHMMPEMDGVETTEKLRERGYPGVIVALTANALVGNDEMFAKKGFDGFLPKPIDIRQLNSMLVKFIRDKYPEEAAKYKKRIPAETYTGRPDSKLLRIFRSDAENAVKALKETAASGDIKLFTTTAHAMKSALANVGEQEASKQAALLEEIGFSGDVGGFIKTLETLIVKYSLENTDGDSDGVDEDTDYLREQLLAVIEACGNYDDDSAHAALSRLKQKTWTTVTKDALEKIHDALFIYSDFDGAADLCAKLLDEVV